ncbi:MAG: alpha/beta fold hydrolase [Phycisphaerales bacterium JB040]
MLEQVKVALPCPSGGAVEALVARSGSGPRFVFLHGLVGLNEHWEDVVGKVSERVSCVTLELPLLELRGADCSIEAVSEITERYLSEHLDGPSVLVGNSFGGHVALRIAHSRPDLVRGMVLAGSSGLFERTMVKGAPVRPNRDWLEEKIGELFYDKSKMSQADVDRAHGVLNAKGGARAMVRLSKSARRNHLGDELSSIQCPTLLVWGREDVVTPPSAAEEFMKLLPDPRIVWIDECGHAPMIEAPEVFAKAVTDFADELDEIEHGAG